MFGWGWTDLDDLAIAIGHLHLRGAERARHLVDDHLARAARTLACIFEIAQLLQALDVRKNRLAVLLDELLDCVHARPYAKILAGEVSERN
ncbi:hypothetical protein APZ15_11820 [Burkholderia cepacia ATCC 25416]|nr:hypothetical protein APZ15_11820 [Burkholderia cepacia ATCC 25416]